MSEQGKKALLPLLISFLLLFSLFSSFTPLASVKASIASSAWLLDFNTVMSTFNLPNDGSGVISNVMWYDTGLGNGYISFAEAVSDWGKITGSYVVPDQVRDYTFILRFKHLNIDPPYSHPQQIIWYMWQEGGGVTANRNFLMVGLDNANTDTPSLFVCLWYPIHGGTFQNPIRKQLNFHSVIDTNTWYTLYITVNWDEAYFYAYLGGQIWSSGELTNLLDTDYFLYNSSSIITKIQGGFWNPPVGADSNHFRGHLDFVQFTIEYTPPWLVTHMVLWHKFDTGFGTVSYDSSGGQYNGEIDLGNWQWLDPTYGKYQYCLGGTTNEGVPQFGIELPPDIPSIDDKFSVSMWFNMLSMTGSAVWEWDIFYGRCVRIYINGQVSGTTYSLSAQSTIGGSTRTLTRTYNLAGNPLGQWIYLFAKYDGANFWFAGVWNNGTLSHNYSTPCTGTITDFGYKNGINNPYGFAYALNAAVYNGYRIDEFKLVHDILSPWWMNGTGYGPTPPNATWVSGAIVDEVWFNATLSPMYIYLTPQNQWKSYATLRINSSGNWVFKLEDWCTLPNHFQIIPSIMSAQSDLGYFEQAISFQAYENTTNYPTTYHGRINVTDLQYGHNVHLLDVYIIVTTYGGTNGTGIDATLEDSPVTLIWNVSFTGVGLEGGYERADRSYIVIWPQIGTGYRPITGLEDVAWYCNKKTKEPYLEYFKRTYDPYYSNWRWFLQYCLTPEVVQYGNFTIYHIVKVYDINEPTIFTTRQDTINVIVYLPLGAPASLIWATLTPSSFEGRPNEIYDATMRVYTRQKTTIKWYVRQQHDYIDPEYIQITGENYKETNCSIALKITLPMMPDYSELQIVIQDLYDPDLYNHCDLVINTTSPIGITISFVIQPDNFTMGPPGNTFGYATSFTAVGTIRSLDDSEKEVWVRFRADEFTDVMSISGVSEDGTLLGTDTAFRFDILFTTTKDVWNGSHPIEFVAKVGNSMTDYVSYTVTIVIIGSSKKGQGGETPTTPTTILTGANLTAVPTNFGIDVYGLGNGMAYSFVLMISQFFGIHFNIIAFGIGIGLLVLIEILVGIGSKGTMPAAFYIMLAVPLSVLNIMLGLWPIMILIAMLIFGMLLLSMKIGGKVIGGAMGGGGGGGSHEEYENEGEEETFEDVD